MKKRIIILLFLIGAVLAMTFLKRPEVEPPIEQDEMIDLIRQNAENAIALIKREEGVDLHFDAESVRIVENYIDKNRDGLDSETRDHFIIIFGAFLGETIIAVHGGHWVQHEDHNWGVKTIGDITAFPFTKVSGLIEYGTVESISSFLRTVPEIAEISRKNNAKETTELSTAHNSEDDATEPSALSTLLQCNSTACQRDALVHIMQDKERYSREVAQQIEVTYRQSDSYQDLSALLYVAALIKSQESLPIIQEIWLDTDKFEHDCIYCCSRSLVLSVFGIHELWKPPSLSEDQRRLAVVANTLHDINKFKNYSPPNESGEQPRIDGDNVWSRETKKALSLNDEQLLEIATDNTATYQQRYVASASLSGGVSDDRLRLEFYWLALNPFNDDAGEGLCFAHECILKAEFYNHKKTRN